MLPLTFIPNGATASAYLGTSDAWEGSVAQAATPLPADTLEELGSIIAAVARVAPSAVEALRRARAEP